jgi:hypothetical protein
MPVRLQLHALAYNRANFLRTLVLPAKVAQWSLTSLREKVVKIGAKVVAHGRYLVFQMAEVAVPRALCGRLLDRIARLRPPLARMLTRAGLPSLPMQARSAPAARLTTAIQAHQPYWCAASSTGRLESGHDGPEIACRTWPTGITQPP